VSFFVLLLGLSIKGKYKMRDQNNNRHKLWGIGTPECQQILNEIRFTDRKRVEFMTLIAMLGSAIMIVLDFTYFANEKHSYLTADIFLFSFSSIFYMLPRMERKISPHKKWFLNQESTSIYPLFMLVWCISIFMIEPNNMLNILSYLFVTFMISFMLILPTKTLILLFLASVAQYSIMVHFLNHEYFTEALVVLLLGFLITISIAIPFRRNRISLQLSKLHIEELNKDLEKTIAIRTEELRRTNEDLENQIKQKQEYEIKLKRALARAEDSEKLKSEFLANMSHEIRTPLNSIIGFTEMITEDGVNDADKKIFQNLVATNTMYLLSVIDDIFDVSFIKTKQLNLILKRVALQSFIQSILSEIPVFKLKYDKENIEFEVNFPEEPIFIETDDYYLKKAVLRLLDNAFKFTRVGKITFTTELNDSYLRFIIRDTGIGIKEEDHEHIFEPFIQGDGSFSRGYGGSGLGLSIALGIVTELGGALRFESKVKQGSNFYIEFQRYKLSI
jgi:signal transduction histidine kinase